MVWLPGNMVFMFISLEITQMAAHLQGLILILMLAHMEHQKIQKELATQETWVM